MLEDIQDFKQNLNKSKQFIKKKKKERKKITLCCYNKMVKNKSSLFFDWQIQISIFTTRYIQINNFVVKRMLEKTIAYMETSWSGHNSNKID